MRAGPNIRKRADGRFEARYVKGRNDNNRIIYGYCYGHSFEEAEKKRCEILDIPYEPKPTAARQMNLLVLGAGGQSQVVKEVARSIGIFQKIAFLDDTVKNDSVIGKICDISDFVNEYPVAIPSVGDSVLRMKWILKLINEGFVLPTLISPTATVSPSAEIGYGTLIEPKVTIGSNAKIGIGCIISSGAVVDRNVVIPDGTHIDCGTTVLRND